jgi:hypothetical protein
LKCLCKPKAQLLICGDINTDYLIKTEIEIETLKATRIKKLDSLFTTYNLLHTVNSYKI